MTTSDEERAAVSQNLVLDNKVQLALLVVTRNQAVKLFLYIDYGVQQSQITSIQPVSMSEMLLFLQGMAMKEFLVMC